MICDLIESYNEIDEENRLQSTLARKVEFLTTTEVLNSYIMPEMNLLDVGCGCGIYSIYYCQKDVHVTSLDIVPKHIEKLIEIIKKKNYKKIDAILGNAVDLSCFKENAYDVVLCMGPLYHLINPKEQHQCVEECLKKLKKGGILAIAYISPYSVFPCVARGDLSRISNSLINKIVEDKKISSKDKECFWTDNQYFTPEDMVDFLMSFHVEIVDHLATDGQSIAFQSMVNEMDEQQFESWMLYHKKICRVPSILGSSNHNLIICRKK